MSGWSVYLYFSYFCSLLANECVYSLQWNVKHMYFISKSESEQKYPPSYIEVCRSIEYIRNLSTTIVNHLSLCKNKRILLPVSVFKYTIGQWVNPMWNYPLIKVQVYVCHSWMSILYFSVGIGFGTWVNVKVLLYSYLILKKMNERITDSWYINKYT